MTVLLQNEEVLEDLKRLSANEIILRWANHLIIPHIIEEQKKNVYKLIKESDDLPSVGQVHQAIAEKALIKKIDDLKKDGFKYLILLISFLRVEILLNCKHKQAKV